MTDTFNIEWLGYNCDPNFDRIWGTLRMDDDRLYVFWGVNGKKIEFKLHKFEAEVQRILKRQERKGFIRIHPKHYEIICPGFYQDIQIYLVEAILSESFR